ncbi:permease for cytosine/purines, uracil, thiamine, allantoin-domain-containing protein [Naematelia encephala]|uniref:Permease for cytosine/purines, uracil, thiamine, allantoin-domain-containing protein n=1 Tax=Naematelia encephala TaxID=71784 RepID=A0A1Y2AN60_9TREE|nr:permease for cytosine/purines, uracil, thiamine, allantoin-domain-containing protein [Naematelia encephala]
MITIAQNTTPGTQEFCQLAKDKTPDHLKMDALKNVKKFAKSTGFLQKPQSAKDAGADDFRPTSGLKPLIHMEPGNNSFWINEDLAPSPPQMRTWSWLSYVSLWWGTNYGVGAWSSGSALLSIGLSFNTTIGASVLGYLLIAFVAVGAARVGSRYHIGFPTWSRAAFGMRGSKIFVGLRGTVAVIWFAVQTYYAALMIDQALCAVSPNGWAKMANHVAASSNVTTRKLVAYFIAWAMHLPFAFVHPSMIKIFFEVKALILPAASWGFLGALVHLAGGSVNFKNLNGTVATTPSAQGWAWMLGINSCFGGIAPMLINQPDIGRYANTPQAAVWPQFVSQFIGSIVVMMLGLTSGAATFQIFGKKVWNVWDICDLILNDENIVTPGWRAGIFLFALTQIYATIGTNLFANSIPFACDFSGLWPQRINIIRGQLFVMAFSWIIQPWSIISSGVKFVTFLGSYTFFCGAMLSVLLCDYYIVRRGNLHTPSLFDAVGNTLNPDGLYMYRSPVKGFNMVAIVSWLLGIAVPLPGLCLSYTSQTGVAATKMKQIYNSGFLISFGITAMFFLAGSYIWKPQIIPSGREGEFVWKYEFLGKTDGYFADEPIVTFGRQSASEVVMDISPEAGLESPDEKYGKEDDIETSVLPVVKSHSESSGSL